MTVADGILRTERMVVSEPGVEIFVRAVRAPNLAERVAIVLVHGGGPAGLASFDLPVPRFSLAADLAAAGHAVYGKDVRGWGRSTRPAALDEHLDDNPPAVRSDEAERDVAAVVRAIRRDDGRRVALVGWATGGHWCAL
jgi:alpha-beta hydrolase superfamily lysophospholipase